LGRFKQARLTAFLLRTQLVKIQKGKPGSEKILNVVYLPKAGFTEDIQASLIGHSCFNVLALDRAIVKAICASFLPKELDNNGYRCDSPSASAAKSAYRSFWIDVLKYLKNGVKIDIMITGNFGYYAEQELAAACKGLRIPFIAMHKENLKGTSLARFYQKVYERRRIPFQGSLICDYNAIERQIQIDANSFPEDKIVITGMPRIDSIHSWRKKRSSSGGSWGETDKQVLFMSFSPKTGLPFMGRKTGERFESLGKDLEPLGWWRLVRECHGAMVKLARLEPNIHVVIKSKDSRMAIETLKDIFGSDFVCPDNLEIVVGGDPFEYIGNSRVVCGFNTTALFEAIAANVPTVVPYFAEADDPAMSLYVVDLEDAAARATSVAGLIEELRYYALADGRSNPDPDLTSAQKRILKKWVGNEDGKAGERVRNAIKNVIDYVDSAS